MDLKQVTFIIKTFERPEACSNCIKSLRTKYPDAYIIVADDSRKPQRPEGADEYYELPFDVGLSTGRNFLVDKVKTKYFVLVDDDIEFYSRTNLELMWEKITTTDFNIIAGHMGKGIWRGTFSQDDKHFYLTFNKPIRQENGVDVYEFTDNFFIAETEVVKKVRWADEIKIQSEHEEFFWRGRNVIKCGVVHSFVGNTKVLNNPLYHSMRYRSFLGVEERYYLGNKHRVCGDRENRHSLQKRKLYRGYEAKTSGNTKFVITGIARSGTHLIQGILDSHSKLNVVGELNWTLSDDEKLKALASADGLIHHYANLELERFRKQVFKNDVKYVLIRRNPLESFASMKRAMMYNVWHNPPLVEEDKTDTSDFKIELYPLEYRFYKLREQEFFDDAINALKENNREYIVVDYNELLGNFDKITKEVQEFLGVPVEDLKIQTNKQITKPLSEVVTNWEEMLEVDKLPPIERPLPINK